ncbi:transcription termination factor NusA [candidate division WWE3 bacterium RIFCSPLOWO2_01_FULL_42_11]|uniref:Transcription termination/antitermination protein NusA n=1 Tax=candidate division WWE3 bacterium RIFCSPLOWO2_01_FULL_42_11 TaxID=1802627 RepID=A0A1F4VP53_UNCKA|nr:MAG: transcription termination factor NusA [candidate division WWE3 bacterium RIFCSPLOWO2_01_FULL_42_11]
MIQSDFASSIQQIANERGIPAESILETIKAAMISAYRKEYEDETTEDITVELDSDSGEFRLFKEGADVTPSGFGRIAAQTAKQVILQRINETEREVVIEEYRHKVGTVVSGQVFRIERGNVIVEMGKAQAVMPPSEQIPGEHYHQGKRIRALLLAIREGEHGAEVLLSRSHADFVRGLFALEVPEISSGTVVIDSIAREAGLRSKVSVHSTQDKVDPVGSCVGQKGVRVQSIMEELGEERVDIIPWDKEIITYIANSLSPAKVKSVTTNEKEMSAQVEVAEDQLSLAIGKGGQNVRLAAKLTGWKIDIKGAEMLTDPAPTDVPEEEGETEKPKKKVVKKTATKKATTKKTTAKKETKVAKPKAVKELVKDDTAQ